MTAKEAPIDEPGRSLASPLFRGVLTLACLAGLGLACFGGVVFRDRQFSYRDAGPYYYPLHLRIQQEWEAGRWPLWAPEANAGMPLLGLPTAAVLYPGKLVFFAMPYPWAARMYVIGHVLLALGAMRAMLRGWHVSATGAALGAMAYAFGAPVLSQTCNVIYLVGAAWAPLGFLAADRWLRLGRRRAIPGLALVLAMQVLGGDPEAAYVTVVCASGYAAGLAAARAPSVVGRLLRRVAAGLVPTYLLLMASSWWSARVNHSLVFAPKGAAPLRTVPTGLLVDGAWGIAAAVVAWKAMGRRGTRGFAPGMAGLAVASALALAVAGAQVVPVYECMRLSVRAAGSGGLHDIFPFSIHPLHALDAIWPDVYGTTDRGNRSWIIALPPAHDPQLWIPSLYLGAMTLVLATAGSGFRALPPWRAWLSWVAVVTLVAGFGEYGGPLLWARGVPGWSATLGPLEPMEGMGIREDGFLRDGDGGFYWLLASALPVLGSFRYPGKLLVFTSLAVSGLAGAGWDRLVAVRCRRAVAVAGVLIAASLAALATTWLLADPLRAGLKQGLAESFGSLHGPLDVEGAIADTRAALAQGCLSLAAALVLSALAARRPALAGTAAVAALALDLGLANARHVIAVPQSAFEEAPRVLEAIREAERSDPAGGPFRVQRVGEWIPPAWLSSASPSRDEEIFRWERGSLRLHYGLTLGVSSTFTFDSTQMFDYGAFFHPWHIRLRKDAALALGLKPGDKVWYHPRRGFDLWNTRYFIVPSSLVWEGPRRGFAAFVPRIKQVYPQPGAFKGPGGPARRERWEASDDVRILRNETAFPRAWVVHRARVFPAIRGMRQLERRRIMTELLFYNDEIWRDPGRPVHDPHLVAWVETDHPDEVAGSLSRADPDPSEAATVTLYEPQRVELAAVLRSPGLVVLADAHYPGWTLTVDGRPAEILRVNRAMRGVALPAGAHRLVFRYEPASFRIGVAASIVGIVALAGVGAWASRGDRSDSAPVQREDRGGEVLDPLADEVGPGLA